MIQKKQSFNLGWKFYLGEIRRHNLVPGFGAGKNPPMHAVEWIKAGHMGVALPEWNDQSWQDVDLPHDWRIEQAFTPDAATSNGSLPGGIGWYRKTFDAPASWLGERIEINFDGVFRDSEVWCNGHFIGRHLSGYTSFRCDLSAVLNYGASNSVAVRVDSSNPEGWWYEGAGIYRNVYLTISPALRLNTVGSWLFTDKIDSAEARLLGTIRVTNDRAERAQFTLTVNTLLPNQEIAATFTNDVQMEGHSTCDVEIKFVLPNPRLWSTDSPNLYEARCSLAEHNQEIDTCSFSFGVRTAVFDANRGFLLNGEPLKLQGVCIHQDFGGVGVALTDNLQEYKLTCLKDLGANAYRSAHHPAAPALLAACDRLGMLVIDENRFFSASDEGHAQVRAMVERHRQHPCVIAWSLGNEEMKMQDSVVGARIAAHLRRLVHFLDPTRPTTLALNFSFAGPLADHVDVVGFNYFPQEYDSFRAVRPKLPMVGTEICATAATRSLYPESAEISEVPHHYSPSDADDKGYCPSAGVRSPLGWGNVPAAAWKPIADRPWVAGGFVWTGMDYRGEPFPLDGWPAVSSNFGLLDLCGFPKDMAYYFRAAWLKTPVLHLCTAWDHPDAIGRAITFPCYTNCELVELYLNGKMVGSQKCLKNEALSWKIPYEPGELLAKGLQAGKCVIETVVKAVGKPARLILGAPRQTFLSHRQDTLPIQVSVVDSNGLVVNQGNALIYYKVNGSARIVGVESGDPASHEPVKRPYRRAFHGQALILIQSLGSGPIEVVAHSEGLETGILRLCANCSN